MSVYINIWIHKLYVECRLEEDGKQERLEIPTESPLCVQETQVGGVGVGGIEPDSESDEEIHSVKRITRKKCRRDVNYSEKWTCNSSSMFYSGDNITTETRSLFQKDCLFLGNFGKNCSKKYTTPSTHVLNKIRYLSRDQNYEDKHSYIFSAKV